MATPQRIKASNTAPHSPFIVQRPKDKRRSKKEAVVKSLITFIPKPTRIYYSTTGDQITDFSFLVPRA